MDHSSSTARALSVLKRELKRRGIRYSDVAAKLGVSEITIKRYLVGKGIDLVALEKLAGIVDLDLLSLVEMAQKQHSTLPELSKAQQTALGRSKLLASVYFGLLRRWRPAQIAKEFGLSSTDLEVSLVKLVNLGIIRRTAPDGVKILAKPNADRNGTGFLADLYRSSAREFLSEVDLSDEKCEWFYNAARISPASAKEVRDLVKTFREQFVAILKKEDTINTVEGQWYRIIVATQPASRRLLEINPAHK